MFAGGGGVSSENYLKKKQQQNNKKTEKTPSVPNYGLFNKVSTVALPHRHMCPSSPWDLWDLAQETGVLKWQLWSQLWSRSVDSHLCHYYLFILLFYAILL